MALNNKPQTLETRLENRSPELGSELEEEDLEKLERDVKQMAEKIADYRAALPDQLKITLASLLSAQRSVLPGIEFGSEPGPSDDRNPDSGGHIESSRGASLSNEEQKNAEKMRLLKEKLSSTISAIPIVVNRMKECIGAIDKLDTCNGTIHPAFKRKKTS